MSANIGRIVAEITANTAGLRRGAADAQRIMQDTSNGASAAGKAIGIAFAVTAALGVVELIDKLEDCTQVAIDNKKALMGLESVAKAYGVSADEAKKATQSFTQDGLLQMKSATIGMKNIISTGFNITEAMNLSKALKDIGAFNNVTGDIGQAFEDATKGMRTGSIELIENIGLTQKLSAVMKAAGVDISNGIDLTNNAAQREAFYNMVLKEGEKFKGNAAKLADDQASSQAKANAAMQEAADAIGNRLLPIYSDLMTVVEGVAKITAEMFNVGDFKKVSTEIETQRTKLSELSSIYLTLKENSNKSNTEQELFLNTIQELKTAYPDFLGNIDLQNIKTAQAIDLFAELNNQLERKYINMMAEAELGDKYKELVKRKSEELQIQKNILLIEAKRAARKEGKAPKIGAMDLVGEQRWYDTYKAALLGTRENIEKLEIEIADTKDKWNNLAYDMDTKGKKTTVYTKPDFLIKLEKDTKEAQRIQAEINKRNEDKNAKEGSGKKESFSLDTSESTKQKLIEQEYKYKVDLANAKEEEKWRVELENKKAIAIINAAAENEKKIAKIREKVESGKLSESAGKKQAQTLNEALAEQLGVFELSEATAKSKAEKAYEKFGKALGLLDINNYIESENLELEVTIVPTFTEENKKYSARDKLFRYGEGHFIPAVGLTSPEQYMTNYTQQGVIGAGGANKEPEYVNKSLEDVTKSFADLASVLDNDVLNALSNVANAAMNMKGSISGFSAAQGAGDVLGMLSGGIGMFSSAVSIFQMVGGLFSKSTYNFDEAVKKMLKGIGEKTPNIQIGAFNYANFLKGLQAKDKSILRKSNGYVYDGIAGEKLSQEEIKTLNDLLSDMSSKVKTDVDKWGNKHTNYFNEAGEVIGTFTETGLGKQQFSNLSESYDGNIKEFLAAADKIVPQLAEQLGTAAGDFGSAIGSALSSATTSEELKANLYDSIYGTVKSGLINAFLAGEVMKPLLGRLQETVTLAVASGGIDETEKTAIQGLLGNVNTEAGKFYDALEEVGLNVVDAAGQLNEAADRMDNVNRNLRLADRISTITTQTSTAGITQLAGNSSIVYDFSNANLGGMTEQQVISAVSKANRIASIRKVGV